MQNLSLEPTSPDRFVAKAATQHTNHLIQNAARTATWVADAHVLGAVAAIVWLGSRGGGLRQRTVADHIAHHCCRSGDRAETNQEGGQPDPSRQGRRRP